MSWPAATIRSRVGTANAGVPINTSFTALLSPLAGFLQLPHLAPDQIAFQRADVADEQFPVEVIGLMQESARQQFIARHLELLALGVPGADGHFQRAHHLFAEGWQAQ